MGKFFTGQGIWYKTELQTIKKKSDEPLQPIYEAVTNAWEAIIEKYGNNLNAGVISVSFYLKNGILQDKKDVPDFDKIIVEDNGIGLTDSNFSRMQTLRDNRKGPLNRGTGRAQYLYAFDETRVESVYKTTESISLKRIVTLSKKDVFLQQNSFLYINDTEEVATDTPTGTKVIFSEPLSKNEEKLYRTINAENFKLELSRHFLVKLCENRGNLPAIYIKRYINGTEIESATIATEDVPTPNKENGITIPYSKVDESKKITFSEHTEEFMLRSFILPANQLPKNAIYLVSKGEIGKTISLTCLNAKDKIDGKHYMFLLSGEYLDQNDRDDRGNIDMMTASDFKKMQKDGDCFSTEVILLDSLVSITNETISNSYPQIVAKYEEKLRDVDELKEMFLLNPQTIASLKATISNTDTEETIIEKIYKSDALIKAQQDAEIKKQFELIKSLNPADNDYQAKLRDKVNEFVATIPLQNRTALTQYVARRKLVLQLFEDILNGELDKIKKGGRIDEDILHNLIFQQSSRDAESSDLWLLNEEYVYFQGFSETRLADMEYKGQKIFDKKFSEEDQRYLYSLGERRLTKRPDILLFPEEGKCIIIEFKAPDVNVAEHITQVNFYASLLRNYTVDEFQFLSFYGYLIGENIEDRDVRGRVSSFEYSPRFNYWFKPSEKVVDFSNNNNGSIYFEIIKYSSILERAKLRNRIFIEKLDKGYQQ